MAFVNEYIPESDFVRYGIAEINRRYAKNSYRSDWTVDRERDIYLRDVFYGRDEFAGNITYTLYWKGSLIEVKLNETGGTSSDQTGWSNYSLLKFDLPENLNSSREEILCDLKEALTARKGDGVYSKRISSTATFNF